MMEMTKELEVFRSAPVPKAVPKNAVPIMNLWFGWGITSTAIATAIGSLA